jgi:hypothetical protein
MNKIKSVLVIIFVGWLFLAILVRLEQSWGNDFEHSFVLDQVIDEKNDMILYKVLSLNDINNFNFLGNPYINGVYIEGSNFVLGDTLKGVTIAPNNCATWKDFFIVFSNSYNYILKE